MKRTGILLLVGLMLMTVILPAAALGEGEADLLSRIKDRGTIIIATEGDWSPFTYLNEDNELVGFDVELGREIAKGLGVEVQFEVAEWDAILAGVSTGRFDMACNGVSYTPERAEAYHFSTPYLYLSSVLAVRNDNEEIKSFEDLQGKKTANTISSIYADIAKEYGATVEGVESLADTFQLLIQGRVDATLNAKVSIEDYLTAHPEAPVKIVAEMVGDIMVIPLQKTESTESLLAAVNDILQAMRDDGRLAALSEKYFGADLTTTEN